MPDSWQEYVNPKTGMVVRASKALGRFRVTELAEDGERATHEGTPGDYLVKGADGRRRVVPAVQFEAEFQPHG